MQGVIDGVIVQALRKSFQDSGILAPVRVEVIKDSLVEAVVLFRSPALHQLRPRIEPRPEGIVGEARKGGYHRSAARYQPLRGDSFREVAAQKDRLLALDRVPLDLDITQIESLHHGMTQLVSLAAQGPHRVQLPDGSEMGPMSYPRLIQLLTTGVIDSRSTKIAKSDGTYLDATRIPELTRFVTSPGLQWKLEELAQAEKQGQLRAAPLLPVVYDIVVKQETGVLHLWQRNRRKKIYFVGLLLAHIFSEFFSIQIFSYIVMRMMSWNNYCRLWSCHWTECPWRCAAGSTSGLGNELKKCRPNYSTRPFERVVNTCPILLKFQKKCVKIKIVYLP